MSEIQKVSNIIKFLVHWSVLIYATHRLSFWRHYMHIYIYNSFHCLIASPTAFSAAPHSPSWPFPEFTKHTWEATVLKGEMSRGGDNRCTRGGGSGGREELWVRKMKEWQPYLMTPIGKLHRVSFESSVGLNRRSFYANLSFLSLAAIYCMLPLIRLIRHWLLFLYVVV